MILDLHSFDISAWQRNKILSPDTKSPNMVCARVSIYLYIYMIWKKSENHKTFPELCVVFSAVVLFSRAVKSMEGAEDNLGNIQELLKNAVFLRQQIKYEEARR